MAVRVAPVNDDWRLQVDPREAEHASLLVEQLEARELEHDLSTEFRDRVIVSRDGARLFLYAGTREQIEAARKVVARLAGHHGWQLDLELRRWHPVAEEWEDPEAPLPQGAAAEAAERGELMDRERLEAERTGHPEYEVRVDLPSRRDAARFAQQLGSEGIPVVHRWKYLLAAATDEDGANALAERIRNEAPAESRVAVEGTWAEAYAEYPHPFAFLGGMAN